MMFEHVRRKIEFSPASFYLILKAYGLLHEIIKREREW